MTDIVAFGQSFLPRARDLFVGFNKKSANDWILLIATALGSLGGFQTAPAFFSRFGIYKMFQFVNLVVLLYQGGAGTDLVFAIVGGAGFFALVEILNALGV